MQRRLRVRLPPSFHEWIAYGTELRQQKKFHRVLRDDFEVNELASHEAISLLLQSEGDLYYAVRKKNLARPDPAVDWYGLDEEEEDETAGRFAHQGVFARHLTTFVFLHMASFLRGQGGGFS